LIRDLRPVFHEILKRVQDDRVVSIKTYGYPMCIGISILTPQKERKVYAKKIKYEK
jgi:hypothetical protein